MKMYSCSAVVEEEEMQSFIYFSKIPLKPIKVMGQVTDDVYKKAYEALVSYVEENVPNEIAARYHLGINKNFFLQNEYKEIVTLNFCFVKKTEAKGKFNVTIPGYVSKAVEENSINLSDFLEKKLKEALKVHVYESKSNEMNVKI